MLFILWLFTKGCSQGPLQWEGSDLELPVCCPFTLETAFVHDNSSPKQVPPRGSEAGFMSMKYDVVTTHLSLVMLSPNVALQGVSFTNLGVSPKVSRDQRGGVRGLTCRGGEGRHQPGWVGWAGCLLRGAHWLQPQSRAPGESSGPLPSVGGIASHRRMSIFPCEPLCLWGLCLMLLLLMRTPLGSPELWPHVDPR